MPLYYIVSNAIILHHMQAYCIVSKCKCTLLYMSRTIMKCCFIVYRTHRFFQAMHWTSQQHGKGMANMAWTRQRHGKDMAETHGRDTCQRHRKGMAKKISFVARIKCIRVTLWSNRSANGSLFHAE